MKQHRRQRRRDRPVSSNPLKSISALTPSQKLVFREWYQEQNLALLGWPGTGKTFIACYLALDAVFHDTLQESVTIVRTAEPVKNIGFLPGTEQEKLQPYEAAYVGIFDELFTFTKSYDQCKHNGVAKFMSTTHMRGINLCNTVVLIDEVQNMTAHEIYTVLTRVGPGCRIIVCGDGGQKDLTKGNDWIKIAELFSQLETISTIEFDINEVVRSDFTKEVILAASRVGII